MKPALFPTLATLLLLGVALHLTGCGKKSDSQSAYETAPVSTGDITQNITATGTLNAVVSVDVGSQISGKILALKADFNSPVKNGEIIAEIDTSTYQASVDEAKGDLANAKAALDLTQITLKRERDLIARHAGPQVDLDTADAEYRKAEATVAIKQALLEKANADLDHCRIVAPVDGIVVSRKVDVGQTVAATMTTPVLFTIAQDIKKMHIIANVSEADIGQVAKGQSAEYTVDAFPDDLFQGNVSQVRLSGTTTENVVTYDTVIDTDNPQEKLFPSMTAEVSIRVAQRNSVLTVPNAALRFTPPDGAKFEAQGNAAPKLTRAQRIIYQPGANPDTLKATVVRIGITDGVNSEVLEGLKAGDRVITASTAPTAKKSGGFGGPPPS
jgi:HlyD family secretion protein